MLQLQLSVCDGLGRIFSGEDKPPEVDRFWSVHYGIRSRIWPEIERQLSVQVISPLGVISDTISRPMLLIEKRRNKLLDYDKLRNRMDKARDVTALVSSLFNSRKPPEISKTVFYFDFTDERRVGHSAEDVSSVERFADRRIAYCV